MEACEAESGVEPEPVTCTFCEIGAGRAPADVVYEDEGVIAFMEVAPMAPGHVLVVPRAHRADIWELTDDEFTRVASAALRLARMIKRALHPDGVTLTHGSGVAAGQEAYHFHLDVIPRYAGDRLQPSWAHPSVVASVGGAAERKSTAARIRLANHLNPMKNPPPDTVFRPIDAAP